MLSTIPCDRIRVLIQEWIDEDEENTISLLSRKAGIDTRLIYGVLQGEIERIEFTTADAIITRAFHPFTWHEDAHLSRIYEMADLNRLDLLRPLDAPGPRAEAKEKLERALKAYGGRVPHAAKALGIGVSTFRSCLERLEARHE